MPLLGFTKENKEKIEIGLKDPYHPKAKRQTIRAIRKDGIKYRKGDRLFLYSGLRIKACWKLGEAICTESTPITMDILEYDKKECFIVYLQTVRLSNSQIETISLNNGFDSIDDFKDFFRDRMPFSGYLIKW